jgi:hypothetical protein
MNLVIITLFKLVSLVVIGWVWLVLAKAITKALSYGYYLTRQGLFQMRYWFILTRDVHVYYLNNEDILVWSSVKGFISRQKSLIYIDFAAPRVCLYHLYDQNYSLMCGSRHWVSLTGTTLRDSQGNTVILDLYDDVSDTSRIRTALLIMERFQDVKDYAQADRTEFLATYLKSISSEQHSPELNQEVNRASDFLRSDYSLAEYHPLQRIEALS